MFKAESQSFRWSPEELGEFPLSHRGKLEAMVSSGGQFKFCKKCPRVTPFWVIISNANVLSFHIILLSNIFKGLILNADIPGWKAGPMETTAIYYISIT